MPQRIHLIAPAGTLHPFYKNLSVANGAEMMALFQESVGALIQLTADLEILDAHEDELRGGRFDDDVRAAEITNALADDDVSAIIGVRGGAWFTRILPKIDFTVLGQRSTPINVFGFSELTPLVNIVADDHEGFHDIGPAFFVYGLKRHAEQALKISDTTNPTAQQWMEENLRQHIAEYLNDRIRIVEGLPTPPIQASLVRGKLESKTVAAFVGGNLTVLSALVGSQFEYAITPSARWLLLEDFNDKVERYDRFLSHFTLAGYWEGCQGLLLGDFHRGQADQLPSLLALLDHHLPDPTLPVLTTRQIGHIWPAVPLPLNRPGHWATTDGREFVWTCIA